MNIPKEMNMAKEMNMPREMSMSSQRGRVSLPSRLVGCRTVNPESTRKVRSSKAE